MWAYPLIDDSPDGQELLGLFADLKAAKAALDKMRKKDSFKSQYVIVARRMKVYSSAVLYTPEQHMKNLLFHAEAILAKYRREVVTPESATIVTTLVSLKAQIEYVNNH